MDMKLVFKYCIYSYNLNSVYEDAEKEGIVLNY